MSLIEPEERSWFNHLGNTKVAVIPSVEDVDRPQLGEVLGDDAVTLDCDLSAEAGLQTSRRTGTINYTPWWGNHVRQYPDRWTPGLSFTSWVPSQEAKCGNTAPHRCNFGTLWDAACRFRSPGVIIIRRGMDTLLPFRAGNLVEVYRGRWGAVSVSDLEDGPALFSVDFIVEQESGFIPDSESCSGTTTIVPGTTPLPCSLIICNDLGQSLSTGGDIRAYGDYDYGDLVFGGGVPGESGHTECDGDVLCTC